MSGEATLEQVWSLVDRHVKLRNAKASSAEVKELRAAQKQVEVGAVPAAIEAFLTRHAARLEVRRGPAGGSSVPKTLKLHPLHRALVAHFGFLEVRVSSDVWPACSHRDGLRIIGFAPDDRWCDLESLGALHRRTQTRRANDTPHPEEKAAAHELALMLPMLTSLEGLDDVWLAASRSVLASGSPQDHSDRDLAGVANPRFGPAYALLARLRLLEQRLVNAETARQFEARCQAIAPVEWTASGSLRLRSDPRVIIHPPLQQLESGYHAGVSTLLEHRYQGHEFKTDAAQKARAEALSKRLSGSSWAMSIQHSGETIKAEYRLSGTYRPEELAYGIGALAHAHRMLADLALPEFDEVPIAVPPEVSTRLEQAGVSAEALRQRLALGGVSSDVVVEAVGQVLPRVRWILEATATPDVWSWRPYEREGHSHKVATIPFVELGDDARLARLAQSLRRESPFGAGHSAAEERQIATTVLAITEETAALLARRPDASPGKERWATLAADRPLSAKDFIAAVRAHGAWLRDRAPGPHVFTSASWLDLSFAIYRGDDPHAPLLQLDASRRDLRGLDATDLQLTAAKLVHVLARGLKLDRAQLTSVLAIDSDFREASFAGADLRGADFSRSDLRGADFRGADCTGADFEKCDLTGARFEGAVLTEMKLEGAIGAPEV